LKYLSLEHVDLLWKAVDLDPNSRSRFVYQVDRLVRQKPVGYVPVRQRCRGDYGRVLNANAMMDLVPFLKTAKYSYRVLDARLADVNLLETPLKRFVLFYVLLILGKRRRADGSQRSASKSGL
jgi:hypothetical protein